MMFSCSDVNVNDITEEMANIKFELNATKQDLYVSTCFMNLIHNIV